MAYKIEIDKTETQETQEVKKIVLALQEAEKMKRANISSVKDYEGHFLGDKSNKTIVKYLKKNNINPDFGFSIVKTDYITELLKNVRNVETSCPITSRPGEYLNAHELNVINVRRAVSAIFTASRVRVIWSWDGMPEEMKGKPVRAREILSHPSARCKIVVLPIVGLDDAQKTSGEITSGVIVDDEGNIMGRADAQDAPVVDDMA